MAVPIAVIIRFSGDPDELLARFEQARLLWVDSKGSDYERPTFYAACRTDDGIAIVNVWHDARAHRAFGQGLHAQIDGLGLDEPDRVERMRVERLGWD
jgi:hypothetical protein